MLAKVASLEPHHKNKKTKNCIKNLAFSLGRNETF